MHKRNFSFLKYEGGGLDKIDCKIKRGMETVLTEWKETNSPRFCGSETTPVVEGKSVGDNHRLNRRPAK